MSEKRLKFNNIKLNKKELNFISFKNLKTSKLTS